MPWRKRDSGVTSKPLLPERRPIALGVLDQLVGFRHPDRAAAALQPVVEQDAGDLAALAGAGAVAEKPAAAEADGVFGVVGRGRDDVEGLVDRPRSGEVTAMGLAGIDDAFELGVGQHAVRDDVGGQVRPIDWAWAARPTPSPPIAPAWWDEPESREYGSTAIRILHKAPR